MCARRASIVGLVVLSLGGVWLAWRGINPRGRPSAHEPRRSDGYERLAVAVVLVMLPRAGGETNVGLQRFDREMAGAREADGWTTVLTDRGGGYGPFSIDDHGRGSVIVEPGRFRWFDFASGVVASSFDIAGDQRVETTLDLSRVAAVRGRVVGPSGVEVRGLRVSHFVLGLGEVGLLGDRYGRTDESGEFEVRVPGDRRVRLHATGRDLVPAQDGGEVEVEGARDDVVLRVVPAP